MDAIDFVELLEAHSSKSHASLDRHGSSDVVLIVKLLEEKRFQMDIDFGVFHSFVAEQLFDMKEVMCAVIFGCAFPVADGSAGDSFKPWISMLEG